MGLTINPNDIEHDTPHAIGPARLTIAQDLDARNPWDEWDCQTPLVWGSLDSYRFDINRHDSGDDILDPFDGVPAPWASRHWRALCAILELEPARHDMKARESVRDYGGGLGDARLELFREALDDMAPMGWGTAVDYFNALAAIWELRGVPALAFQRNGYCQGDSVLGLLVATPAHAARCGFNLKNPGHDIRASLESDADLFGAWAFGDVFGFILEDSDGEPLDSCWGFYGYPWGCNPEPGNAWHVLEAAAEALEGLAPAEAREAQHKAQAARRAFLDGKAEAQAAQAQGFKGPNLCAAVRAHLARVAQEWRDARRRARAWGALAAQVEA